MRIEIVMITEIATIIETAMTTEIAWTVIDLTGNEIDPIETATETAVIEIEMIVKGIEIENETLEREIVTMVATVTATKLIQHFLKRSKQIYRRGS